MPVAVKSVAQEWTTTLDSAYKHRIQPQRLDGVFRSLSKKTSPPSRLIIECILNAGPRAPYDKDPLIARYLEQLLKARCILPADLLLGILHNSAFSRSGAESSVATASIGFPTLEEKVFVMIKNQVDESYFSGAKKLQDLVLGITKWLHTISVFEITRQVDLGPVHAVSSSAATMYEALAVLAYTVFSHKAFQDVDKHKWWRSKRAIVVAELDKYDINILQVIHSQAAGFLHNLTTQRPFLATDDRSRPSLTLEQVFTAVPIVPTANTRAGLFIWLCTCLDSRIMPDDATIRNHILARHQDNVQNAIISLILASFDALSRPKDVIQPQTRINTSSFIYNKLPVLLTSFATLLGSQGFEHCVSMALLSLGSEATSTNYEGLQHVKQQFVRACMLHELITQTTFVASMPEYADTAPVAIKLNQATLIAQCESNVARLDGMLGELEKMDGNAGAVAVCVVEVFRSLCSAKDIMSLKEISTKLLRRLTSMDIILQYARPADMLVPVCRLLNDWTEDEDHTEFQPPYEDFACIWLFVSAVIHRYGLTVVDLEVTDNASFLGRTLTGGLTSFSAQDMTSKQSNQLALWIQGLYATDENGEIVGISDEVYSACPPQAFYILVPTILEQTMLACKTKVLSSAITKAGLEFLLEPFLLPSLISGLKWLGTSSWKDSEETAIRLQMIEKLVKPAGSSPEVQMMHKAALNIVAVDVEHSLQCLLRTTSQKKKEINTLIQLLRPYCDQAESPSLSRSSESDASPAFRTQLSTSVEELLNWVMSSTIKPPPSFSGRLMPRCVQILGPSQTLEFILHEIMPRINDNNGHPVLDICSALICAASLRSYTSAGTSRQGSMVYYLHLMTSTTQSLLSMAPDKVEALVRLQRCVDTQSAISPLATQLTMVAMALPTQHATDPIIQDLSLATQDGVLAAGVVDGAGLGNTDPSSQGLEELLANPDKLLDLSSSDNIFDFGLDSTSSDPQLGSFSTSLNAGNVDAAGSAEDDIFGDLDMTDLGGYDFT